MMSPSRALCVSSALAVVAFAGAATAQDKIQVVKDVPGSTLEVAVTNGLVRALEQVKGFNLTASLGLRKRHASERLEISSGMDSLFARHDATGISMGDVYRSTRGLIRTYEILEQAQDAKTRDWKVSLKVTIPVYDPKNPRPGAKRTIAIVGFRTPRASFQVAGGTVSAKDINRKLLERAETHFVQSKKFLVLNRDFQKELGDELRLVASSNMAFNEQVKLGNQMGADFLIVGNIEGFTWESRPFEVKVTGYKGVRITASYNVTFKLIDVATNETRWSDSMRRVFSDDELKHLSAEEQDMQIVDFLADKAADEMAGKVLGQMYPIKVAGVSGSRIVINAGGKRVRAGDEFDVFILGEVFKDPDSGEVLGSGEEQVGKIAVEQVRDRMSFARVISGDIKKIQKGAVCRPVPAARR